MGAVTFGTRTHSPRDGVDQKFYRILGCLGWLGFRPGYLADGQRTRLHNEHKQVHCVCLV
jgi:hypothetical protein